MKRHEGVFEIDIGVHLRVLLQDRELRPVRGSMVSGRERADVSGLRIDLIAAGEGAVRGIVEIAARTGVRQIVGRIEADGESTLVEIVELVVAGRLGAEEAPASGAYFIDPCGDLFTGREFDTLS